jgi:hypothetical protein
MKYSYFFLLGVILFGFSMLGCQKASNNSHDVISMDGIEFAKRLSCDTNFLDLISELESYNIFLLGFIKAENSTQDDLIKHVKNLQATNLTIDEQYEYLSRTFGSAFSARLKTHIWHCQRRIKLLKREHGEFQYETLISAIQMLNKSPNLHLSRDTSLYSFSDDRACGLRYFVCMGAVYAGAIICHAACTSTALAVPVCVAGCAAMQLHYSLECREKYCQQVNLN